MKEATKVVNEFYAENAERISKKKRKSE